MSLHTLKIVILTLLLILTNNVKSAEAQNGSLSKEVRKQVQKAIFEVLILKPNFKKFTYDRELPFHLLPFEYRNDPYQGIGSAFLLENGSFISAAHVFFSFISERTPFYLRDSEGNIYLVGEFLKYSKQRDLVEFKIKTPLKNKIKGLSLSKKSELGDSIYSAGNAMGEGIIFRQGEITSYTSEEYSGLFKYIRFSAPASPGNSGGPLLNQKGEVLGVISRKSESENLNFAIPIAELFKLQKNQGEYFAYFPLSLDKQTSSFKVEKTITLPMTLPKLEEAIFNLIANTYKRELEQFIKKNRESLFPYSAKLQKYFSDQSYSFFPTELNVDSAGTWMITPKDGIKSYRITPKQELLVKDNGDEGSSGTMTSFDFILQKPEGMSLNEFIKSPQIYNDTFIKAIGLYKSFGEEKIKTISMKDPDESSKITDRFGRVWTISIWNLESSSMQVELACLPHPMGISCTWLQGSILTIKFSNLFLPEGLERSHLSLRGTIKEWQEFLASPEAVQSHPYLKGSLITINPDTHEITIQNSLTTLKVESGNGKGSEEDQLFLGIAYQKDGERERDDIKLSIEHLLLKFQQMKGASLSIQKIHKPLSDSSEVKKEEFQKMVSEKRPFDGKWIESGDEKFLSQIKARDENSLLLFQCRGKSSDSGNISSICQN